MAPTQDLDELLRSSLTNQMYVGHRPELWEEQTGVQLMIKDAPPSDVARVYQEADMEEKNELREKLLAYLISYEVELHFVKGDGTSTVMRCTLAKHLIPEFEFKKLKVAQEQIPLSLGQLLLTVDPSAELNRGKPQKPEDPNLIKVWALDRQGWRSFKLDRVTRILVHAGDDLT